MIKAIFFDLFETLVTEANGSKITSSSITEKLNIPLNEYKRLVSELRDCRYPCASMVIFRGGLVDGRQNR